MTGFFDLNKYRYKFTVGNLLSRHRNPLPKFNFVMLSNTVYHQLKLENQLLLEKKISKRYFHILYLQYHKFFKKIIVKLSQTS